MSEIESLVRRLGMQGKAAATVRDKASEYARLATARLGHGGLGQVRHPLPPPPPVVDDTAGAAFHSLHHCLCTAGRAVQGRSLRGASLPDAGHAARRGTHPAAQWSGRGRVSKHQGGADQGAGGDEQGHRPGPVHSGEAHAQQRGGDGGSDGEEGGPLLPG